MRDYEADLVRTLDTRQEVIKSNGTGLIIHRRLKVTIGMFLRKTKYLQGFLSAY